MDYDCRDRTGEQWNPIRFGNMIGWCFNDYHDENQSLLEDLTEFAQRYRNWYNDMRDEELQILSEVLPLGGEGNMRKQALGNVIRGALAPTSAIVGSPPSASSVKSRAPATRGPRPQSCDPPSGLAISDRDWSVQVQSVMKSLEGVLFRANQEARTSVDFGFKFRDLKENHLHVSRSLENYPSLLLLLQEVTTSFGEGHSFDTSDPLWNIVINRYDDTIRDSLAPHIDSVKYGDKIYGITAVLEESSPRLELVHAGGSYTIDEQVGRAFCFTGDSRYLWKHTLNRYEGEKGSRVSITWRRVEPHVASWIKLGDSDIRFQWVSTFLSQIHENDFQYILKKTFDRCKNLAFGPLLDPRRPQDQELLTRLQAISFESVIDPFALEADMMNPYSFSHLIQTWANSCPESALELRSSRDLFEVSDFDNQTGFDEKLRTTFRTGTDRDPWEHQILSVQNMVSAYQKWMLSEESKGGVVVQITPGGGKSNTIATLLTVLTEARVADLVLVTNNRIQCDNQLSTTSISFLGQQHTIDHSSIRHAQSEFELKDSIQQAVGRRDNGEQPIICFAMCQKIQKLKEITPLDDTLRVVVIADEAHKYYSKESETLAALEHYFSRSSRFYFGFSGTPQKQHEFGDILKGLTRQAAIDQEIVEDVLVNIDDFNQSTLEDKVSAFVGEFQKWCSHPTLQAMVQVGSIEAVKEWATALRGHDYIRQHKVTVAAAFSAKQGEVTDSIFNFNQGFSVAHPETARILVVCGKFEEGYDNPHLVLSARDRSGRAKAQVVQSLCRLCRKCEEKKDGVRVINFVKNDRGEDENRMTKVEIIEAFGVFEEGDATDDEDGDDASPGCSPVGSHRSRSILGSRLQGTSGMFADHGRSSSGFKASGRGRRPTCTSSSSSHFDDSRQHAIPLGRGRKGMSADFGRSSSGVKASGRSRRSSCSSSSSKQEATPLGHGRGVCRFMGKFSFRGSSSSSSTSVASSLTSPSEGKSPRGGSGRHFDFSCAVGGQTKDNNDSRGPQDRIAGRRSVPHTTKAKRLHPHSGLLRVAADIDSMHIKSPKGSQKPPITGKRDSSQSPTNTDGADADQSPKRIRDPQSAAYFKNDGPQFEPPYPVPSEFVNADHSVRWDDQTLYFQYSHNGVENDEWVGRFILGDVTDASGQPLPFNDRFGKVFQKIFEDERYWYLIQYWDRAEKLEPEEMKKDHQSWLNHQQTHAP